MTTITDTAIMSRADLEREVTRLHAENDALVETIQEQHTEILGLREQLDNSVPMEQA